MKTPKRSVTCFLGAGYSFVEGVPLAKDLLRANYVLALSEASHRRFTALREHYEDWQQRHPADYPEQYLVRIIREGAESGVWGDEIAPKMIVAA